MSTRTNAEDQKDVMRLSRLLKRSFSIKTSGNRTAGRTTADEPDTPQSFNTVAVRYILSSGFFSFDYHFVYCDRESNAKICEYEKKERKNR